MDDAAPCVVDASAILPVVDYERCSARAERWFAAAESCAADSATVDLFDAECANALWKRVRRELWSAEDAQRALRRILDLPFQRVPVRAVVSEALVLGVESGLSAYDACYVALAIASRLPLVTADRRMARVARQAGCEAICFAEEG